MKTMTSTDARSIPAGPAANSLIGHIVAKDLRRLWPLVALWFLVTILSLAAHGTLTWWFAFALAPARLLSLYFLVALVVLQDPLTGPDAFWRTRPISPRLLLASKTVFIAIFVLLPAIVVEMIQLPRTGVPEAWHPRLLGMSALWLVDSVIIVAVAAAAVGGLARFTVFLLTTWVAMIFVSIAVYAVLFRGHRSDSGILTAEGLGPTMAMLAIGGAVAAIALMLLVRGRSLPLARALIAPPLLLVVMITPGENFLLSELGAIASHRPPPGLDVSVESIRPATGRGTDALDVTFLARPRGPRMVVGSAWVAEVKNGTPVRPGAAGSRPIFSTGLTPQLMAPALESSDRAFPASKVPWLLDRPGAPEAAGSSALDLDAEFGLQEVTLLSLPLKEGARVDHRDSSYRIRSLSFEDGRLGLTIIVTSLRPGFGERADDLFLANRGRREVATFSESSSGSPGAPDLVIPWPSVRVRELTVRSEGDLPGWNDESNGSTTGPYRSKRGLLSDGWLSGAELVALERVDCGVVTRSFRGVAIDSTAAGGQR